MDAAEWDRRYAGSDLVWSATPNLFVEAELADLPPGRAVDVAAGEGRNAVWLARRGWRVTAVDFSRAGIDKGRALAERLGAVGPGIEWVCADVVDHDLGQQVHDLAVLAYLQLPADKRRTVVRRAFTSLRVGGRLLVVAHDSTNLAEGTGGPQDPEVLYTAEDVLADLDGERFEVVRADRVTRDVTAPDLGGSTRTAYDALVHVIRTSAA
jgi:SAM-dependent methyltransferase